MPGRWRGARLRARLPLRSLRRRETPREARSDASLQSLLQHFASSMYPAAYGTDGSGDSRGDLLVAEAADVAKDHRFAEVVGKVEQRRLDVVPEPHGRQDLIRSEERRVGK